MSAKLTSQRRISPHEGQEGGSIGSASAAASFGWRNGCASPGEGVDSCRQRSQIGNPGLYREFTTDNWYIRYFNPTTVWVHLDSLETLERAVSDCSAVWLNTTAVRYLTDEAQPEFEEYAERVRSGTLSEVVGGELALRFVQLSKAKSIGGCRDADVDLA